jgi:hypothetical protein
LPDPARRARKRRDDIRQEISNLGELSDIAALFSNPACYVRLLFPFVGVKSKRFDFNKETKWSYMGKEKFKELLDSLHDEQWHHGTRSAV